MKRLRTLFFAFIVPFITLGAGLIEAAPKEKIIEFSDALGSAVLYTPRGKKADTGVIVVHEWWGLNDYARNRARQLANEGYAAIAVDMYGHGKVATHPKDATAFMNAALAEPEKMNARFNAAKAELEKLKKVDRIFAIGYCFGGAVVLNQARMGNDLAGVASFHGSLGTQTPAQEGKVKAKVLVATGGADPMVPAKQVGDFVTEMGEAGVNLQLLSFPGVLHSFTNPDATAKGKETGLPVAYDEAADKQSWSALMRFLKE
ncbi:dienelactone hydrolase family protein [Litorivivens sp.]|uniref:dienelactone hydrolase family protein n=1 Tax=Litorivivens sp. TaxID=2020868 RepID=UPI003569C1E8